MRRFFVIVIAWLVAAGIALCQSITGTIGGAVEDQTGAAIPQASVVALHVETGISHKSTTGDAGVYVLPLLPLGEYQVTIEAAGFKKFVRGGLKLEADQRLRVDARVELGSVSEEVTVSAAPPLVTTDQATLGRSFSPSQFDNVAISRSVVNMMILVPGIQANNQGLAVGNMNGSRDTTSDFKVDGVPTMHTGNALVSNPPPILELVEQVVVETASYSAEYGRGAAQINLTTRPGTNRVRGTLFHYFQNDRLSANGFMNNFNGIDRAILRMNLFGGTIGGPVYLPKIYDGRNRTFFSFGYEGSRTRGLGSHVATVPLAPLRAGDFTGQPAIYDPATTRANPAGTGFVRDAFPGNRIPANRVDPVAAKILEIGYPLPNAAGTANNYVLTGSNPGSANGINSRVDHNFSDKSRLSGRLRHNVTHAGLVQSYPGPAGAGNVANQLRDISHQVVGGDHTYVLRPSVVNNFHFGFYRMFTTALPPGTGEGWAEKIGLKNLAPDTFPKVAVTGLSGTGGGNYIRRTQAFNFQFSDTVVSIHGRHAFRAGVEYRPLRSVDWSAGNSSGNFTFNTLPTMNPQNRRDGVGFASFLLGIPSNTVVALIPPITQDVSDERWKYWSGFVQDDFRAAGNLTLNFGVRWELNCGRTTINNWQSSFNLKTLQLDYAGQNGYPESLYDAPKKGFQPRVGFAYTPFGNRTVFRGGYGMYIMPPNGAVQGFHTGPWNRSYTYVSPDNGITFPITFRNAVPPMSFDEPFTLSALTAVSWLPRDFTDAYMQQWSFNVQRELRPGMLAEAGYVGTRGTHLPLNYELNQVPKERLGPGDAQARRPYPTRGGIGADRSPVGNSTYHSLQARFERRMSAGVSWQAVYTFSKSIDDASGFAPDRSMGVTTVQDSYDLRAERSLSAFDMPHNFSANVVWDLPVGKGRRFLNHGGVLNAVAGGWTLSSLTTIQSGVPLEMSNLSNLTGSFSGGSRPNRLGAGKLEGAARTRLNWFDPKAFAQPEAFTYGNTSRSEPGLRAPGVVSMNVFMGKEFRITESKRVQLRSEFFNALNHFNPGRPNAVIGSPGVATITDGNAGRVIQLSLRLSY